MLDSSNSNTPEFGGSKKSSIDDGLMCTTPKTRRSPLRFLGNFVDDKILRGRWGSTKRAKSSVELGRLTWEIPDDLTDSNTGKQKLNRRKSSNNKEDNEQNNKQEVQTIHKTAINEKVDNINNANNTTTTTVTVSPKAITPSILKRKPRSLSTCVSDRVRNRIPSATSDRLSLSSSSAIGSDDATDIFLPQHTLRTEISADALAEIEVILSSFPTKDCIHLIVLLLKKSLFRRLRGWLRVYSMKVHLINDVFDVGIN